MFDDDILSEKDKEFNSFRGLSYYLLSPWAFLALAEVKEPRGKCASLRLAPRLASPPLVPCVSGLCVEFTEYTRNPMAVNHSGGS